MRCPDCNKFVGYDEPQVDVESEDIDSNTVTVQIHEVLPCQECGTELKEAYMDVEIADIECPECGGDPRDENGNHKKSVDPDATDEEYLEIDGVDAEPIDRFEDKDRHGKPIKNMRYMKHYYGASVTVHLRCKKCGHEFSVEETTELVASEFDEMV
jgi:DNA-directed RNA polymerase subunit RPC12/RpoP